MDFFSKVTLPHIKIQGLSLDQAMQQLDNNPEPEEQPGHEFLAWVSCYNDCCLVHSRTRFLTTFFLEGQRHFSHCTMPTSYSSMPLPRTSLPKKEFQLYLNRLRLDKQPFLTLAKPITSYPSSRLACHLSDNSLFVPPRKTTTADI